MKFISRREVPSVAEKANEQTFETLGRVVTVLMKMQCAVTINTRCLQFVFCFTEYYIDFSSVLSASKAFKWQGSNSLENTDKRSPIRSYFWPDCHNVPPRPLLELRA